MDEGDTIMCDFRNITKIKLVPEGTIIDIKEDVGALFEDVGCKGPNLYSIIATGSWHVYYDGRHIREECGQPSYMRVDKHKCFIVLEYNWPKGYEKNAATV